YSDMEMAHALTPEDLPKIEEEMKRRIDENLEIDRIEGSRDKAQTMFKETGADLKLELIAAIPESEQVTIYKQCEFFDLCRGIHVPTTSKIKAFKLLSISGAYWRGDSNNQQLQRIYGTAFEKQSQV